MLEKYIGVKVAVFIDEANIYHSQKTLGWKVNYRTLLDFFKQYTNLVSIAMYTSFVSENIVQTERLKMLAVYGYEIYTKHIKFIRNFDGTYTKKGNLDIELALDAYRYRKDYDLAVLFSGDSDFAYLLNLLKLESKKIVVISTRKHISKELLDCADEYIDLKRLENWIRVR